MKAYRPRPATKRFEACTKQFVEIETDSLIEAQKSARWQNSLGRSCSIIDNTTGQITHYPIGTRD